MPKRSMHRETVVGIAGLGLMGRGIAACLLSRGFRVVAYNRTAARARAARPFLAETLQQLVRRRVIGPARIRDWRDRFRTVRSCKGLGPCTFVIECIKEDLGLKCTLFDRLEEHVSPATVIASNTSSFPLALLQQGRRYPGRFVVMHWSEPAWITRFMEIVRNEKTSAGAVRQAEQLGQRCDKEPAVINFDIRGFITNRLMYAFIREACYLADLGVADIEMIDRSFRNDVGWWATLAGPFRWMDLTGIQSYAAVMEELLPELADSKELPQIMRKMRARGARGIANQKGFYQYDKQAAKAWEEAWVDFTFDIRKLVKKYEARLGQTGAPTP